MFKRLADPELKFYIILDEILWKDWDPIGVYGAGDDARDEYRDYLPEIYKMIKLNESERDISNYLFHIETEIMNLPENRGRCGKVATLVLSARDKFLE